MDGSDDGYADVTIFLCIVAVLIFVVITGGYDNAPPRPGWASGLSWALPLIAMLAAVCYLPWLLVGGHERLAQDPRDAARLSHVPRSRLGGRRLGLARRCAAEI